MSKAICLGDVGSAALRNLLGNRCFGKALLAISATATACKTGVTDTYYNLSVVPAAGYPA